MDPNTWQKAFDVYDTYGDLSLEEFKTEIEKLSLTQEIRDILLDLKMKESEASNYFGNLSEKVTDFMEPPTPEKLGTWHIRSLIDIGGMSSVYLAERDDEQFSMKAAAKFIHFTGYNPSVIKRFNREMQFLALLDHPNITRIIDSGVTEHGVPWYIMEYVEGLPITQYCNENKLNLNERLRLFKQVCYAVQHAHKNLVIHRDLKPSNIFVDNNGQVKLLDFGIAKALSPDDAEKPGQMLTRENQALMTPEYASPEQLEGGQVNTTSDVYALGIILHELITGKRPFEFEELNRVTMVNQIKSRPVTNPSTTFRSITEKPAGLITDSINRELDDLILMALKAEPELRYTSAEQLSRDIGNFLNNKPLIARSDSRGYRFKKFVQRNSTSVSIAVLALFIFLAGVGGMLWQAEQTRIEAERTLAESERAVAMKDFLVEMITASNPFVQPGETPTALDLLQQGADMVEERLAAQPALAAEIHGVIGSSYLGLSQMQLANKHLGAALELIETGAELDQQTVLEFQYSYAFTLLASGDFEGAKSIAENTLSQMAGSTNNNELKSGLHLVLHDARSLTGDFEGAHESTRRAVEIACSETELNSQCIDAMLYHRDAQSHVGLHDESFATAERAWELVQILHEGTEHPQIVSAARIYANALYRNGRASDSIPILEQSLGLAEKYFGEISFNYAITLDDLGRAYTFSGQSHRALPIFNRAWKIGTKAEPRHSYSPVWLIRIVQTAMDLRMDDHAEAAYQEYLNMLPENVPERTAAFINLQTFRIDALRQPGEPATVQKIEELLQYAREAGYAQILQVSLLYAATQAIETGSADKARGLLQEYADVSEGLSPTDMQNFISGMLQARLRLLDGDTITAMQFTADASAFLREIGQEESPYLAESNAILAEIHCSAGNITEGQNRLSESLRYWNETAGVENGAIEMRRLAPSCS